jgi:hypothetical protein
MNAIMTHRHHYLNSTFTLFRLITLCLCFGVFPTMISATPVAATPPAELRQVYPSPQLIGEGKMTFFTLAIYTIRLWSPAPLNAVVFDQNRLSVPLALELLYARSLEGKLIAERSLVEMRRVSNDPQLLEERSAQWLEQMSQAFPNVQAGDRLSGVFDGKDRMQFYHNGKPTLEIVDADFARFFLGIWLHPKTSEPALRQSLLGIP